MEIKTGDKVTIKTWDEMAGKENIILDSRGSLCEKGTSYSFTKYMKRFCGSAAIVTDVSDNGEISLFFDEFENANFKFREWMLDLEERSITVFMVTNDEE